MARTDTAEKRRVQKAIATLFSQYESRLLDGRSEPPIEREKIDAFFKLFGLVARNVAEIECAIAVPGGTTTRQLEQMTLVLLDKSGKEVGRAEVADAHAAWVATS